MRRIGITLVVLSLALALSASGSASHLSPEGFKNVSKYCKALRAEMGASAFRQAFAVSRGKGHGKCVSRRGVLVEVPPPSPFVCLPVDPTLPELPLPVSAFVGEPCVVEPPLPVSAFGADGSVAPDAAAQSGAGSGKHASKHDKKHK